MLWGQTPDRRGLHTLFTKGRRNGQKWPETRSRDHGFKPIQAEFKLAVRRACDYTKRPEVPRHYSPPKQEESAVQQRIRGLASAWTPLTLVPLSLSRMRAKSGRAATEIHRPEANCFRVRR